MTPTAAEDLVATLSQRERQIFSHIIGGSPLKVIAADLGLSTGTVHTYAHRIRSKLGVGTVPDIVRYAHSRGLHLTSEEG
jgi:FixJ family two-component response regulator